MSMSQTSDSTSWKDRRRYPRYYVTSGLTMAIEDASLRESIGLGEPGDISIGGVRVRNLPACENVKVGDRLEMLLLDREDGTDAGMVQGGSSLRFTLETGESLCIFGNLVRQEFEGDKAMQLYVLSLVDDAHAAAA